MPTQPPLRPAHLAKPWFDTVVGKAEANRSEGARGGSGEVVWNVLHVYNDQQEQAVGELLRYLRYHCLATIVTLPAARSRGEGEVAERDRKTEAIRNKDGPSKGGAASAAKELEGTPSAAKELAGAASAAKDLALRGPPPSPTNGLFVADIQKSDSAEQTVATLRGLHRWLRGSCEGGCEAASLRSASLLAVWVVLRQKIPASPLLRVWSLDETQNKLVAEGGVGGERRAKGRR
jgi:hypothetical protein